MKRLISMILVLAMMLGFVNMINIQAFAETEEPQIESFITAEPETATAAPEATPEASPESEEAQPAPHQEKQKASTKALNPSGVISEASVRLVNFTPGTAIPAAPVIEEVDYDIEATAQWGYPGWEASSDTVFEDGKRYPLTVTLYAPDGLIFVDGEEPYDYDVNVGIYWYRTQTVLSADGKILQLYTDVESCMQEVRYANLEGHPEKISVGAAPDLNLYTDDEYDPVEVIDAWWVDGNKNPVTSFQNGKGYFLAVKMQPADGYIFDEDFTYIYLHYRYQSDCQIESKQLCTAYFYYSTLEHIEKVEITGTQPQIGMDINSLTASCSGNATIERISVYDQDEYEYVTEGKFQQNKTYRIEYSLKAKTGYDFYGWTDFTVNGKADDFRSYGSEAIAQVYFSTYPVVERADVTLTPYSPNMKVSDVRLTVEPDAHYEVSYLDVYNDGGVMGATETLIPGEWYSVSFDLKTKEGYTFSDDCQLYINGQLAENQDSNSDPRYFSSNVQYGKSVSYVYIEDLPGSIEPGAAEIPDIYVGPIYDVEQTGVQWVDENKNPVTAFQNGKLYYLAVSIRAVNGYAFYCEPRVATYDEYGHNIGGSFQILTETTGVVYVRYNDLMPIAEYVELSVNKPREGMSFSDLSCTVVEGEAVLHSITVCYADSDAEVTETKFLPNKNYLIWYELEPKAGYEFNRDETEVRYNSDAFVVDGPWNNTTDTSMRLSVGLTTYTLIEKVEVFAPELTLGSQLSQWVPSVSADANYYIDSYSYSAYDEYGDFYVEDTDIVEDGCRYQLNVHLAPKSGYGFAEQCSGSFNGEYEYCYTDMNFPKASMFVSYDFSMPEIWLENLPHYIEPGPVPELEDEIYDWEGVVTVTGAQWVDVNKKAVTKLEDGKVYYLAVTMDMQDGRRFGSNLVINDEELTEDQYTLLDSDTAVVYLRYSLEPAVEEVYITVNGLQEGNKIENITATVAGNATLAELIVKEYVYNRYYEYWNYQEVTSGVIKPGTIYQLDYVLKAKSGYRFNAGTAAIVDGEDCAWGCEDQTLYVTSFFDTCEKIPEVKITMAEPKVGMTFGQLTPTIPTNANYTLRYYWEEASEWEEMQATDKVQDKQKYYLRLEIVPNAGYAMARDAVITINGKAQEYYGSSDPAEILSFSVKYSFLEKISRVDLPAMPKSVSQGKTLPSNFTVADSKKYTLEAYWYNSTIGQIVTKADKSGLYALCFRATVKEGCEFDENTKVYVDGKEVKDVYLGGNYVFIQKNYNVGLPEVTKVEITTSGVEAGKTPKVTVSGKNYTMSGYAFAQSTNSKFDENLNGWNVVEVLEKDKYTVLAVSVEAKEGCVIADEVVWYINGEKVNPVLEEKDTYYSSYRVACFSMGKMGAVTKPLSAPKISVSGETISWAAVANADSYDVYRATSKSGNYSKITTVTETSYTDSADGKTYYYKVKAVYSANTKMNSGYSNYVSVTFKLDVPVVSVENDSKGKPKLSWAKVSGASKYTVYRSTSATSGFKNIGTSKTTSYTDSKASAGTTYYYKVVANGSKSSFNSGYSNVISCGVICGTPSVTVKIDANTGKPSLSWKKVDGAAKYAIYRDGELLAEQTGVTYADKTAPIDTVCQYYVQALGKTADLNGAASKVVSATSGIAKPAAKGSIDAVSGKPVLTWAAVEGAAKYEVYRSTKSNKSYSLVATVEELTYTDTSVSAGKTYYYQVKAVGGVSKSANSSYVKLTGKCATPAITVESNAKAQPVISWEKISGAKKYTVYRSTSETSGYKSIGTSKTTSYTDTKATPGKVYYYKVIANASSSKYNSGYSNIVSCGVNCATPVVKVSNNANGKTVLTWSKVTGATKYEIYLLGAEDYVTLATVTGTTWTDADGVVGDERYYGVRAIASAAEFSSEVSAAVFGKAIPATPKVSGKVGANKKPVLTWGEVEGATKYIVYRSTSKSKNYKIIGESETLTYEDLTAAKGKTYYYKVVAVGDGVQSAQSSYAKVKSK